MAKRIRIIPWLDESQLNKQLNNIGKKKQKIKVDLDSTNINNANKNMRKLNDTAVNSNTIFGKLRNTISNTFSSGKVAMTSYIMVLNEINKAGQNAKQTIQDIDKAITDLSVAMNGTRAEASEYVKVLNKQAIDLKTTTKSVTDASDAWLRQGKSIKETETLIRDSLVLSKVGKIESADATDYLTSALNGYKLEAEGAISVVDKLTSVDAESASEAGGLALSMSRTASAADMAGVSMNKLIGWLAVVKETTRDSDEAVGNMAKTMLSRMNQVRAGKFIDAETGESLNDMEKVLNKVGIAMRDANGQFISSEIVLDELGKKFNEFDSVTQRAIATQLGGTYQYEKVIALLSNYGDALKYAEIAADSTGSAMEKFNESYMGSLEASQARLQASFESMVINSDFDEVYAGIIDATTALVDFINETNTLKGIFTGLTVAGGIKAFLAIKTGINEAYISLNKFSSALSIVKQTKISTKDYDRLLLLSKGLSTSQTKLILSTKNLSVAQKERLLMSQGLSRSEARLQLQTWGMVTAQTGLTAATTTLGNAFKGLWATLISNPLVLVTTLISGITMAYQSYNQKLEETRQKNIEASETAIEHANSLRELYDEYMRLSSIQERTSSEEESFKAVIEDVTKALGDKAKALEGLTADTNEYASALANATKEELQSASADATIGRKSAEEELQEKIWSDWSGSKVSVDSNGSGKALSDEAQRAVGIVSEALKEYETVNRTWDNLSWDISSNNPEEAIAYYNALLKAREALVLASENDEELLNTEIYADLNTAINSMSESLDSYIQKRYEEEKLGYMARNGIPQTTEDYEAMKDAIVNTVGISEALKNEFDELLTVDFSNLSAEIETMADDMGALADKASDVSFTETLSELDKMQEKFDILDKTLAKLHSEDSQIGLEDYSSINEAFKDVEGIERYIKRLQEAGQNQEEVADVMSDLIGAYINQTGILDKVNDENADLIAQTLTEMGVEGAHELVLQRLASAKEIASLKSFDLANATTDEILKLIEEGQVSDETAHYLLTYALKKQLANGTTLTTASDIENIKALVLALGGAIDELNAFQSAKNGVLRELKNPNETKHTGNNKVYDEGSYGDINAAQEEIDDVLNEPYKYRGGNATSKATSSGSSGGGGKDSQKETEETFNWIETRLERLNEQTSDLADKFSKAFTLSSAESAYKDYLSAIGAEIEANNQAIAYYQQKLNEVGLAYEWIQKIQSGALSVDTITDENLINQINEYQSYYDKILSIQDTLKQLEEERLQAQLDYANKIIEQHEKEIKQAEKLMNFYKFIVDLKDTFGTLASRDDLRNEQYVSATQIEMLEEQNNQMMQLLYTVDYMSEAWQTYYDKIEENKESIKELTKELADLAIEMANLPIEKYNQYLDKNASKNELYDAKLSNYTSTKSKNKTIDKQIALADKNNAKAQSTAEETAKNLEWASGQNFKDAWDMDYGKAVYYGQTAQAEQIKTYYAEIQKYVKAGKQVPSSLISQLSDGNYASLIYAVNNYNASLIANETAQATAKLSAEQTKTEKRTLQMAKFNNIQTKYERKQDDISHKASVLSSQMDLAVAKGYLASEGWYKKLISYEKKNQSSLKKELTSLQAEFANMEKYTDEWWEMQDAIEDVTEAIYKGEIALQEYKDALAQVKFDQFDYIQEQISRLTSEADFLIEAMSNKELKGDRGLTDYGLATMGLHKQNYDTYLSEAQKYGEMINKINEDLAKNPYDTDLINQLHEYEDAQRDCILAAEDEKKAIADLMKEGYDALINSLSDLISKYKEFIQNAKDAHDYQKNISEQSENINTLRKRISAYSAMSGNEEIAVKLQQANKELAEAQENLEETMYDKYISDTQDALDNMLSELEQFVNELYQNIDELFRDGVNMVVASTDKISKTLIDTADSFGTSYSGLSTAINNVWKNGYNFNYAFTQIITDLDALVAASNAQYDKVADTEVYNSVKDKYKDMSGAESNISTAENNSAKLDAKAQDAKAKWETAKSQLADAKAVTKSVKEKYGTKSQQYKDAQALVDSAQANVDKLYKTYQRAQGVADASKLDITEAKMQYETLRRSNYNVVNDFLNGIANSQMDSTSLSSNLGNVINQITGGYIADYNVEQLAKLLGTSTDENAILDVLEKLGFQFVRGMTLSSNDIKGFATGGVGTLVKPNGEDGLAWVRNGEGFVSPENVADIQNLMRLVPDMSKFLNVTLPNYDNVIANRNIGNNVTVDIGGIGDIYMSGVNDVNEFSKVLVKSIQDNTKVKNTISTLVNDSIMGKNSLGINRF